MKTFLLSIFLSVGLAVSGFSQGTIAFQNFSNAGGGLVMGWGPGPYTGNINLELFWGPVGSTTAQVLALNSGVVFSTTISTSTPGKFFDGSTVTTTLPAGTGTSDTTMNGELVIAGWTGNYANYAAAIAAGPSVNNAFGSTSAFANPTGGAGTPPSNPAGLINWTLANSLYFTPEPSPLAVGGLGFAVLFLIRRRK